jgi:phosphatidylglycerol lysyltransferase
MLWARARGYASFDLGMAPLSGLSDHTLAPAWSRLGAFVFRHGEEFYNFQGLRRYKAKFGGVWQPRYLASAGGLAVGGLVLDLAALHARGPRLAAEARTRAAADAMVAYRRSVRNFAVSEAPFDVSRRAK